MLMTAIPFLDGFLVNFKYSGMYSRQQNFQSKADADNIKNNEGFKY